MLEMNKERIGRCDFEGGKGGALGHVGKSNVAGATYGLRIEP